MRTITIALLVLVAAAGAQYRCDWSVVGIAGGEMASSEYRCVATAGQSVAGFMTSSDYWALVGFWVPEGQTGEVAQWSSGRVLQTRLYSPFPTPFSRTVSIRYTLGAERPVSLQVHDLTGRVVRTLVASSMKRGAYRVAWDGKDGHSRTLANGVYFLKFTAGDYRQTHKLVMQK